MEEQWNALRVHLASDRGPFPALATAHDKLPAPLDLDQAAFAKVSAPGEVLLLSGNAVVRPSLPQLPNVRIVPVFPPRSSVFNDIPQAGRTMRAPTDPSMEVANAAGHGLRSFVTGESNAV